jgi:hypothetical protein
MAVPAPGLIYSTGRGGLSSLLGTDRLRVHETPDWKSQNTSITANSVNGEQRRGDATRRMLEGRSHNRHCAATVEYDWADLHDEEDRKGAIVERHSSDSMDDLTEFGNENIS